MGRLLLILEKRSTKMTDTEEQAIWKPYPDYPFIEANQFGEVRAVDRVVMRKDGKKYPVKSHILKQYKNKNGYIYVHFGLNGKVVNLLVHRIIATCFVPNPHNLPEVNHKDNDRTNNAASNLEWCTRQYNSDYKNNFGTSAAEVLGHPTFAVDLITGKVLRFETQSEAAHQLGVSVGDLNNVIKGLYNQTGGYWFTEDESEITEEKIKEIKANMHFYGGVIAVNTETFEVFCFESQQEAARQLGVNRGNIGSVARGQRNRAGNYWFCYADENAVEKIREKFGGEIANKVKELMEHNSLKDK